MFKRYIMPKARAVGAVLFRVGRKATVAALAAALSAAGAGVVAGLDWRAILAICGGKAVAAGWLVWRTSNVPAKVVDAATE